MNDATQINYLKQIVAELSRMNKTLSALASAHQNKATGEEIETAVENVLRKLYKTTYDFSLSSLHTRE